MAYETRKFNAAFTRALQKSLFLKRNQKYKMFGLNKNMNFFILWVEINSGDIYNVIIFIFR